MRWGSSLCIFFLLTTLGLLTACDGSSSKSSKLNNDDDTSSDDPPAANVITGTAATGAPISGFVYIRGTGSENEVNTAIGTDGKYQISVTGLTGPFLLRAVPDDTSQATEYSFAATTNSTANITPLTSLALFEASGNANLAIIWRDWANASTLITSTRVDAAASQIHQAFAPQFTAAGVDTDFDLFTSSFEANSSGFDAALDNVSVSIDYPSGTMTVDGEAVTLSDLLDAANGSGAGTIWSLTITGSMEITASTMPAITIPVEPNTVELDQLSFPTEADATTALIGVAGEGVTAVNITLTEESDSRVVFNAQGDVAIESGISQRFDLTLTYAR